MTHVAPAPVRWDVPIPHAAWHHLDVNIERHERLLRVRTLSGQGWTVPAIADQLGVSGRTVERDRRWLRDCGHLPDDTAQVLAARNRPPGCTYGARRPHGPDATPHHCPRPECVEPNRAWRKPYQRARYRARRAA